MIRRMPVYVLGAGASVSAGYPLASNLLQSLSTWLDGCDPEEQWVSEVRNLVVQLRQKFGTLEDFEGILGKLEGNDDPVLHAGPYSLRSDLAKALREYFFEIEERRTGQNAYDAFAERKADTDSSVITFNYDIALERSLVKAGKWKVQNGYGYQFSSDSSTVPIMPIYKLHGSVNWFKHPPNDLPPPIMFTRDLALLGCHGLKDPRVGDNGISVDDLGTLILPDPSKTFTWSHFWDYLWGAAAERLRAAEEVFIHGYSMPAADLRARNLLFDNIDKSAEVTIHCRGSSDRIAEEFRSRGFLNLTPFPTIGFEDWAIS